MNKVIPIHKMVGMEILFSFSDFLCVCVCVRFHSSFSLFRWALILAQFWQMSYNKHCIWTSEPQIPKV